ncbi:hypothetical protein I9W82_004831 [Candida metapsilosis]|uniref:Uncharacterized protein n=1 Tax=Candida metapsilosis TaxID=273372 RepID=A0A8H7ZDX2_9ASCO|nr:hypothetical protein I9W82_004831 [Candida metapsilosis]
MWYKQDKAGVSRWIRLYFPKDINNCKTNSYTFISVFTLRKYYKEMDGDQVIHHFELYEYENETFTLILNYFKLIKNFEIIKCPCNRCSHNTIIKREIQKGLQPFDGSYTIFTPLAFELTPMSSATTFTSWNINLICTPSSAETEEGDSKSSLNFTTLTSIDFQPKDCYALKPCLLKLHKLHSHHHYDKVIRTPWATLYDAAILRELALVGTFDFQNVFPIGNLTIEYPLLRQLCIRIRLKKSLVSAIANLGHLRHDTLSSLIISYDTNNNTVAREICKLFLTFLLV